MSDTESLAKLVARAVVDSGSITQEALHERINRIAAYAWRIGYERALEDIERRLPDWNPPKAAA